MEYFTNPEIPENLDGAQDGHGRSFVIIMLKALGFMAAFIIIVDILSRLLAPLVPFSWEKALVPDSLLRPAVEAEARQIETELNALAAKVAAAMDLPPELSIRVHYSNDPTVNALATFGGQVIVFRGLLEHLDSEDALAAVLAHEIGHVKNRDVIKGLMRAVSLAILAGAVGSSSNNASGGLESAAGQIGLLSYSRGQEAAADREAILALGRVYGHTQGFEDCFKALLAAELGFARFTPEIFSSHPDTVKRINKSKELAAELGLPNQGPKLPLGGALRVEKNEP